jgi:hypothetical protein
MTSFYQAQAARFIETAGEGTSLTCTIPSERDMDVRYELKCVESPTGVEVLSCSCPSRKPCKHREIVQAFWNRIYKSSNVNLRKVG